MVAVVVVGVKRRSGGSGRRDQDGQHDRFCRRGSDGGAGTGGSGMPRSSTGSCRMNCHASHVCVVSKYCNLQFDKFLKPSHFAGAGSHWVKLAH